MPKGSDAGLVSKFFDAAGKKHANLRRAPKVKLGFVVRHYAGEVTYDGGGFVDKNKDSCPPPYTHTLHPLTPLVAPHTAHGFCDGHIRGGGGSCGSI